MTPHTYAVPHQVLDDTYTMCALGGIMRNLDQGIIRLITFRCLYHTIFIIFNVFPGAF